MRDGARRGLHVETAVREDFEPGRAVLKGFNFHVRQKITFARLVQIAIREA